MEIIQNKVSIQINALAQKVYDITTTPINWIKLHPTTQAIYGPNVKKSAVINDLWIEHGRDVQRPVNATWYVTVAEPFKKWQIKSAFFNGQKILVTITYLFDEVDGITTFTRIMDTEVAKDTSDALKDFFANSESNIKFLKCVKNVLENSK